MQADHLLIENPQQSACRHSSHAALRKLIFSLCNVADERRAQGRYAEAEPLYERALALAEQVCGPLEVAIICNNLAVAHKYTGRLAEAARLYLPLLEQTLGPEHPEIAVLYHNLGGLEHARGRFATGEPLARRSVEIRERTLGPNHPDVAADIAALAAILDGQGRYDESEPLYRRALEIFEREYGPEHYEIAVNLNNLAALKYTQGHLDEAEQLYRRSLVIKEKLLTAEHPDVGVTLNNLAVLCKAQGRYAEAAALYTRALAIFEQSFGPQHPKVISCRENYERLRRKIEANVTHDSGHTTQRGEASSLPTTV